MNKPLTSIIVGFILFVSLGNDFAQKQNAANPGIRTSMVVSRQNILPYESLSVMLLLSNESTEDKRVVAAWCSFVTIGETTPDGTKWRGYRGDNEPFSTPCIPGAKTLVPGESKVVRAHIDFEAPSGQHVFAHPGEYLLKSGTTDSDQRFVSDPIKIVVRTPRGIDAKAYEFLQTNNLTHFFGEYTISKYKYDHKTVDDFEEFIADFDGSEYSYLARMGLAFMWLKGVEGKQDQSRAIELLTQVAERAGDPLASSAEYHLGRIEYSGGTSMPERQQKIVKANYHFQRVLNGTPSPYFKYLAEEALRQR